MEDLTYLKIFFAKILRPIIHEAVDEVLQKNAKNAPTNTIAEVPTIIDSLQVRQMTGWPDSTFYHKIATMPSGIVIRGKSKRLLFDREKLIAWLKTPVEA